MNKCLNHVENLRTHAVVLNKLEKRSREAYGSPPRWSHVGPILAMFIVISLMISAVSDYPNIHIYIYISYIISSLTTSEYITKIVLRWVVWWVVYGRVYDGLCSNPVVLMVFVMVKRC